MKTKYKNFSDEEIQEMEEEMDLEFGIDENEFDLEEEIEQDDYEIMSSEMLTKINELPIGAERSRAIVDLKNMQEISCNRQKTKTDKRVKNIQAQKELELKAKNLEKELVIKEEEMALRKEELKNQKRGTLITVGAQIFGTILSFVGYSILLQRQNEFESGDSYSTNGSRGLTQNISHFVGRGK